MVELSLQCRACAVYVLADPNAGDGVIRKRDEHQAFTVKAPAMALEGEVKAVETVSLPAAWQVIRVGGVKVHKEAWRSIRAQRMAL